jgi:predicted AAA+ superfamily ATPase
MYLKRSIDREMTAWRQEKEAKPLLIRGARQVGKSTAVRHLAEQVKKTQIDSFGYRESKSSNAEVDYVVQKGQRIIPVEIKSGKQRAMQSLHLFLKEKNSPYGVRFSLENYAAYENIQVYPLYTVSDWVE